jgi:hypothetical protein
MVERFEDAEGQGGFESAEGECYVENCIVDHVRRGVPLLPTACELHEYERRAYERLRDAIAAAGGAT